VIQILKVILMISAQSVVLGLSVTGRIKVTEGITNTLHESHQAKVRE
jgi:hypothetical protein